MNSDSWNDRRKALEESFFMNRNRELLEDLKKQMSRDERKAALRMSCGIDNEEVLDQLLDAEIGPETVTALALAPLVAVAWADGKMDDREREAILKAAESEGIERANLSYQILERWLETDPDGKLIAAWKGYVQVMREQFSHAAYEAFYDDVMGRTRKVAQAAGGLLGLNSISPSEQRVIDDLESAFSK